MLEYKEQTKIIIIIDYPLFSDKVRLSNGLKVDTSFVIKTDTIKNYEN